MGCHSGNDWDACFLSATSLGGAGLAVGGGGYGAALSYVGAFSPSIGGSTPTLHTTI